MSGVSAGGLRSPKATRPTCGFKAARAGGLGADACNGLGLTEREHSKTDIGPTGQAILGPESPSLIGVEPDREGKNWGAATGLLPR